ncbi:penicillin-binding protein activator LpoB [uncultured Desulfuromusa sp.]|uniref:penicillin-binding protein activator LpoB n=1 Tax=uncultured Desulfuromusa sp. TaxID=219183 RepID=UPI002AA8041B|nr:penicillin-binding protein activator LpoB [uncultured Desulfuromusa sp.]
MNRVSLLLKMVFVGFFIFIVAGCSVTTREVGSDEKVIYDEGYHFSDKKAIVDDMVASLLSKYPLLRATDRPVLIVYGIANRTTEHISTSAMTDDIRQALLNSGRVRFVNKAQRSNIERETSYQYGGSVAAETRIQKARQVGAKYMLTGTLRSIEKKQPRQFRLKKKTLMYYSLNMELTDIQTGLIEWADSTEVIREASKPFIGW